MVSNLCGRILANGFYGFRIPEGRGGIATPDKYEGGPKREAEARRRDKEREGTRRNEEALEVGFAAVRDPETTSLSSVVS